MSETHKPFLHLNEGVKIIANIVSLSHKIHKSSTDFIFMLLETLTLAKCFVQHLTADTGVWGIMTSNVTGKPRLYYLHLVKELKSPLSIL